MGNDASVYIDFIWWLFGLGRGTMWWRFEALVPTEEGSTPGALYALVESM